MEDVIPPSLSTNSGYNGTSAAHNTSAANSNDLFTFVYDMETYYLWVILLLGFPGNCATIITVIKMSPARSLTVYISLLAVVDNLAIINKLLVFVLLDYGINIGNIGCKSFGFFGNYFVTFANWLLVAMSIERFGAVWYPLKFGQVWTFRKSVVAVSILSVIISVLFIHLFWTMMFGSDIDSGMVFCDVYDEYKHFMMHYWYWINVTVYAVVPCALLFIFNVLIILEISRAGKMQKYLNPSHGLKAKLSISDRNRQITVMLVSAAITLIVLTTPRCVMLVLTPYWIPDEDTEEASVHYLIDTLAYVLCDSTHAVNFYVYSLSARRFRGHFIDLVMSCCRQKSKSTTQYITMSSRTSARSKTGPLARVSSL